MCCEHLLSGEIPYKVIDLETLEYKEYNYLGQYSEDKRQAGELQPGFYYVSATGAFYVLYNGTNVLKDDDIKYRFEYRLDPMRQRLDKGYTWDLKKSVDGLNYYEVKRNVENFLGEEKYQPTLDNICSGLEILKEHLKGDECQS